MRQKPVEALNETQLTAIKFFPEPQSHLAFAILDLHCSLINAETRTEADSATTSSKMRQNSENSTELLRTEPNLRLD